eukprot:14550301-Ditylum_brightwellii.AAC.1
MAHNYSQVFECNGCKIPQSAYLHLIEGILRVFGFGPTGRDEEKAVEHQDGTDDEDGNITNATVTVPDGCGPVLNTQDFFVWDGADNLLRIREMDQ